MLSLQLLVNPVMEQCHIDVDSRGFVIPTANAPSHHTNLMVSVFLSNNWADEWTAAISFAGVLALLSPSADKALVQLKVLPQAGSTQSLLTFVVWDHRQV